VEYRGDTGEVYDVKSLFNRIFKRRLVGRSGGKLARARDRTDSEMRWTRSNFLYMGWNSRYIL
jgi:hypothetical protein